jgi:hypothetical protein
MPGHTKEGIMAGPGVRCCCPHCDSHLNLKDARLAGKKIKCPRCHGVFVVEPLGTEEVEEASRPTAPGRARPRESDDRIQDEKAGPRNTAARRTGDDEEEDARARRHDDEDDRPRRSRDRDEEDEEDRPRRKKRRKPKQSSVLLWALIGGGMVVVAGVTILLVVLLNRKSGDDGAGPHAGGVADQFVDVGGPWPEPPPFRGWAPSPDSVITFHVALIGTSFQRDGREGIQDAEELVAIKLAALVGPMVGPRTGSLGASTDGPGGQRRMTSLYAPVTQPAQALADKIDFGTVRSVNGRTITLVVRVPEGPPASADAVTRALYRLQRAGPRGREEAARSLKDVKPDQRRDEVAKALEPLLADPKSSAREPAMEALGAWGNKDTVAVLIKALDHQEARSAALRAIGRLKDERAIEPIARYFDDVGELGAAADALKSMGPAAETVVRKQLKHKSLQVRLKACEVLEVIGTKASLQDLEAVSKDLGGPADRAIKAINGRP